VVAGLWDADDEGTKELMRLFYEGLAEGKRVGEALNAAQRSLSKDHNASQWAGFEVIGDPLVSVVGLTRPENGLERRGRRAAVGFGSLTLGCLGGFLLMRARRS
jgi:hypothetical protein